MSHSWFTVVAVLLVGSFGSAVFAQSAGRNPLSTYRSIPNDPSFFPIGVWAQSPADAGRYKELGVNFYLALHGGPTAEQVAEMRKHQMPFVGHLNEYAQQNLLNEPLAWGWMHGDEPDLAHVYPRARLLQPDGKEIIKAKWPELYRQLNLDTEDYKGWGLGANPVNDTQADYRRIKRVDRARPVLVNLSLAVAYDGTHKSRGDRSGHAEDYPEYIKGADWISYDVYPVANGTPDELWRVSKGLDNLKKWGAEKKPLMMILEAGFGEKWANHHQQRAQVWLAINHGASGITWFCHRWVTEGGTKRMFTTRMPLVNAEVGDAIKRINAEVTELAAVINSPALPNVATAGEGVKLDLGVRRHGGAIYVFAVEAEGKDGQGTIQLGNVRNATVEVINEDRQITVENGVLTDTFEGWDVHLYKITPSR